jgi:hypothetical protein
LVLSLADTPVKSIACGGSHSGVIAANGDVYLWGNGQYGQLGNGAVRNRRVPTKIRTLQGKHVTQLAFGEWHSMALCEGDVLYSWGFGEEGQLGLPEDELKHSRIVPNPSMVHELSGTGATMVRCGGSHTFVVSVLEARRPQLARIHRRASHNETSKKNDSGATKRPTESNHVDRDALTHTRSWPNKGTVELLTDPDAHEQLRKKSIKVIAKKKSCIDKIDSAREPETAATIPAHTPITFLWKEQPMTTRDSVRNALRQEVKALAQLRDSLSPIPMACSTRAKTANAFISPRLKRLHEQVLRATEAGAGLLKCQSIVDTDEIDASIVDAVQTATICLQDTEIFRLRMTRNPRLQHTSLRDNDESACAQPNDPQALADMLRELRGNKAETASEDEHTSQRSDDNDDDEVVAIRNDGKLACQELEREIKWRLANLSP